MPGGRKSYFLPHQGEPVFLLEPCLGLWPALIFRFGQRVGCVLTPIQGADPSLFQGNRCNHDRSRCNRSGPNSSAGSAPAISRRWKTYTGYSPMAYGFIFWRQLGPQDLTDRVHDLFSDRHRVHPKRRAARAGTSDGLCADGGSPSGRRAHPCGARAASELLSIGHGHAPPRRPLEAGAPRDPPAIQRRRAAHPVSDAESGARGAGALLPGRAAGRGHLRGDAIDRDTVSAPQIARQGAVRDACRGRLRKPGASAARS